jgi:phosphoribosylglycinamide formyltransferase 1
VTDPGASAAQPPLPLGERAPPLAAPGRPLRVGVLASGRGSNLRVLLERCADGALPARVVALGANHSDAPALLVADAHGVPREAVPRAGHANRLQQQRRLADFLDSHGAQLIVLAGFDRVLEPEIVERFAGRLINLHPSLLPAFAGGLHAIADALAYGVKVTGVTVHFVTSEVDAGPIILQEAVPVLPGDTLATLGARVQDVEHRLLPEAVLLYAEGRLEVEGRHVLVRP